MSNIHLLAGDGQLHLNTFAVVEVADDDVTLGHLALPAEVVLGGADAREPGGIDAFPLPP